MPAPLVAFLRPRLAAPESRRVVRVLVRPRPWRTAAFVLTLAGGLTAVQLVSAALDHLSAPRVDAACVHHRDCGNDEHCLRHLPLQHRYCTRRCEGDGDCPDGMRCGDIGTLPNANRGVGAAGAVAASSACIRSAP